MRRSAPIRHLTLLLIALSWALFGFAQEKECEGDEYVGFVCTISGTTPGDDPDSTGEKAKQPQPSPPPFRYLVVEGGCYRWSRVGPGLDTRIIGTENEIYQIIFNNPSCRGDPERAWRIFRSFPLATPAPTFQPVDHGITGHPTYLAAANPATITHSEVLPNGETFEVRALVASMTVDWGDGWTTTDDPAFALPYPAGAVTHTYTTKTCPPDYRVTHPSGPNCHPELEAYPVNATFTWWGEYRVGGGWIPIGTLDLSTTVFYDVDEVIGVLVDP